MVFRDFPRVMDSQKPFFHREGHEEREEKIKRTRMLTSRPSRSSRFITTFCECIKVDDAPKNIFSRQDAEIAKNSFLDNDCLTLRLRRPAKVFAF